MTTGPKRSRTSKDTSPSSSFSNHCLKPSGDIQYNGDVSQAESFYPTVLQRGQRRYGPPSDWKDDPPRGTEVHVSKLPRDMLEDELIPVFERIGKIFDIRLMMDNAEMNKGYAFVRFCFREDSETAITQLHDYEIRHNVRIGVRKSIDNNRLFIGNIPKSYMSEDVLKSMREVSPGVVKVILYASVNDRSKNRGYGFVEFETHQQAKNTRNKLKTSPLVWSGQEVKVDWAEPEPEVDEETMKKVRILYVRNLALPTTDNQLRELFSKFGGIIERVKKIKDYAFIHFATREQAEEAKEKLQGYVLDNCEIDISWSKPVTNREEYQQRKAASKALSTGTTLVSPLAQAAFGLNGEPILINQRVRTAAGAQGYNASRPYPVRPKQTEESFSSLQSSLVYPGLNCIQDLAVRNPIEAFGLQTPLQQPVYTTTDRVAQVEDYLASSQDVSYQIAQPQLLQRFQPLIAPSPYNIVATSPLNNCWGTQSYIQPGSTAPTFIPAAPYVVPTASFTPIPAGTYTGQPYYGGQMMTQLPSVTGSNMSIDRT